MKKVTFEEALAVIRNNITQAYTYACYNKSTKQNVGVLEEETHNMVEILEKYINPLTWGDVKKALEDAYPLSDAEYQHPFIIVSFDDKMVQMIGLGDEKIYVSNFGEGSSMTELDAIVVATKFLEMQEIRNG